MRWALAALGTLVGGYGAFLLLTRRSAGDVLDAGLWLAGGVVAHDLVWAPLVLLAGLLATRVVPASARAPVVAGLVVLGTVTVVALPVLGRFGARADNPTLLDRPYVSGWLLLVGITAVAVTVAILVRARVSRRRSNTCSG